MNFQNMKLDILLHSLVFRLMMAEDDEEREFLMEIWESAMAARQEFLDDVKRLDEENKQGRMVFKPRRPLTDDEKAERRRERIERNSKWN